MSACPEWEFRASLTDEEFWAHVFSSVGEEAFIEEMEDVVTQILSQPCEECGSTGACAYDSEGRPMIHSLEDKEDE